ncbi:hypothetical protein B0H12DRAFT_89979 [Mycena haematopus]|nr:hypothetical protein B0H12DRAFT_89979 [Mycena haematopus]
MYLELDMIRTEPMSSVSLILSHVYKHFPLALMLNLVFVAARTIRRKYTPHGFARLFTGCTHSSQLYSRPLACRIATAFLLTLTLSPKT